MNAKFEAAMSRIPHLPTSIGSNSESGHSHRVPRLLVSVRALTEAKQAIEGGAEILDIKEPSLGSLGMADLREIETISKWNETSAVIPLSVALGEAADWFPQSVVPSLPAGITFVKLGLSQCANHGNWKHEWGRIRLEVEERSASRFRWVAAAYADSTAANSPTVSEVLQAAIETECAGLLIDTWQKGNKSLFDFTDNSSLRRIARECHAAGLFFAVAGRLGLGSLPTLVNTSPDVIAIRSAACQQSVRTSELDPNLVKNFRIEMQNQFLPS